MEKMWDETVCSREESVAFLLYGLMHQFMCQAKQILATEDIKKGQGGILYVLSRYGNLSQRELADCLSVTPPSITVSIRKMEIAGYVQRTQDEKDRRIIRLGLTDRGKQVIEKGKNAFEEMAEKLTEGMADDELRQLKDYIRQMRDNISEGGDVHA